MSPPPRTAPAPRPRTAEPVPRFTPDPNLEREVYKASTEGRGNLARSVATAARATSRVVSGAYRGGIYVQVNTGTGDVDVGDSDELAAIKEFGTVDTPAQLTLSNAARRYGRLSGSVLEQNHADRPRRRRQRKR